MSTPEISAAIYALCDEAEKYARDMPSDMTAARARLIAAIDAAVLAEREACAREADDEVTSAKRLGSVDGARFAGYVAKHIRARGAR